MKKLIKTLAIVCATALVSVAAPAPKKFAVGMYNVKDSHVLKVYVEKLKGDDLKVELKDASGTAISTMYGSKKTAIEGFKIDMTNLSDGKYKVVVSNGNEKIEKDLDLVKKIEVENKIIL